MIHPIDFILILPYNPGFDIYFNSEFTQNLPASVTLDDNSFSEPKEFDCAAQGEDKTLFSLSWQIG